MGVRITKTLLDELAEIAKVGTIVSDSELRGFGVRRNKNGSATYVVQYRMGGRGSKSRRITLGHHGSPWTSAEARAEARRLLGLVATGVDPAITQSEPQSDYTVAAAASDFSRLYLRPNWPRSYRDAEHVMENVVVPAIGIKHVTDVSRRDVNAILDKLVGRPARLKFCHSEVARFV
jgi:hypothetical protein